MSLILTTTDLTLTLYYVWPWPACVHLGVNVEVKHTAVFSI